MRNNRNKNTEEGESKCHESVVYETANKKGGGWWLLLGLNETGPNSYTSIEMSSIISAQETCEYSAGQIKD
jgi:glycosyltransferase A (GT-A) superfamily protein (DUF2064 family)